MSDRARPDTLVGRLIDAVLDATVISFAGWTLLYCLGLPTQWSLWPSGWIWLGFTVVVLVVRIRLAIPEDPDASPAEAAADSDEWDVSEPRLERRDLVLLAGLGLVAVSAVGGLIWTTSTFRFTWAALVLGILLLVAWSWLTGRVRPTTEPVGPTRLRPEVAWSARRSSACSP